MTMCGAVALTDWGLRSDEVRSEEAGYHTRMSDYDPECWGAGGR